jgi:hypothetical protein
MSSNGALNGQAEGNGHAQVNRIAGLDPLAPPYDLEVERCVLGGMIVNPAMIPIIAGILEPDDFFRASHSLLCRVLFDLHRDGALIEGLAVALELQRLGLFDEIGGHAGLGAILERAGSGLTADFYATHIRSAGVVRRRLSALEAGVHDLRAHPDDPSRVVSRVVADLQALDRSLGPRTPRRPAHAGDLRLTLSDVRMVWDGWFPASRVCGIAAAEGCGKTLLTLDLARRIWHGLPWPDGQPATFPPHTPTLWVCSDGNQEDICEALPRLNLPDEAVFFNTFPEDLYGGTDLDVRDTIDNLREFIPSIRPAFVVVDTLTNATSRDLCRQADVKTIVSPLKRLAQDYQQLFLLLLHLSREGVALGRRIRGLTRILMHLDCPDPENQPYRRKFWVDKSIVKKPPPLGVTMGDHGNEYDTDPPVAPDGSPAGGRLPDKSDKARQFIRDAIRLADRRLMEVKQEFIDGGGAERTFWRARDELVNSGEITCEGIPKMLHLIVPEPIPDAGPPF